MKLISNEGQYITEQTLDQCFELGVLNHVDKVKCGNGFSTSFIKSPVPHGRIRLMIVPNKGVLEQKEDAYRSGELATENVLGFMYGDTDDITFNECNMLLLIADTFVYMQSYFRAIIGKIDRVLIDEYHSVEQQSMFRKNLHWLIEIVNRDFVQHCAVTTVTASPNQGSPITITIENEYIPPVEWIVKYDAREVLEEIRKRIKNKERVIVATNNKNILAPCRQNIEKRVLKARFVIGSTLFSKLTKVLQLNNSKDDDVVLMSSRGFEGHDIHGTGYHFYFIEDRATDWNSHFISNIYQASNRARDGCASITYCRSERETPRQIKTIDQVERFISNDRMSTESKLSKNQIKGFREFIHQDKRNNQIEIIPNHVNIKLMEEKKKFDIGFSDFEEFTNRRNIKVIHKEETQHRPKQVREKRDIMIENLYNNREMIKAKGIFGEDHILKEKIIKEKNRTTLIAKYQKLYDDFIIEKNYDGQYAMSERQKIAWHLIFDADIDKNVRLLVKDYAKYHREKSTQVVADK